MECFNCGCKEYIEEKYDYEEGSGFKHVIDILRCKDCRTILKRIFKG